MNVQNPGPPKRAGLKLSLDSREDTHLGFPRITIENFFILLWSVQKELISTSWKCAFCEKAGCLSCVYIYLKSKTTAAPPPVFCLPVPHGHIHSWRLQLCCINFYICSASHSVWHTWEGFFFFLTCLNDYYWDNCWNVLSLALTLYLGGDRLSLEY